MNKLIKTLTFSTTLLFSAICVAQLPSWGMTESQYRQPDLSSKLSEIGTQAVSKNWLLKVTAPSDWHDTIKDALTKTGDRDVQFTFKDSLYKSISITAVPGAKTAKISSSNSSTSTVRKQVVIDKPDMDSTINTPDFSDAEMAGEMVDLEMEIEPIQMTLPHLNDVTTQASNSKAKAPVNKPKTVIRNDQVKIKNTDANESKVTKKTVVIADTDSQKTGQATNASDPSNAEQAVATNKATNTQSAANQVAGPNEAAIEKIKETMRKRIAKSKGVDREIDYLNINEDDDVFITETVVLVRRSITSIRDRFYWMSEPLNPEVHKFVKKGSITYAKDFSNSKDAGT